MMTKRVGLTNHDGLTARQYASTSKGGCGGVPTSSVKDGGACGGGIAFGGILDAYWEALSRRMRSTSTGSNGRGCERPESAGRPNAARRRVQTEMRRRRSRRVASAVAVLK